MVGIKKKRSVIVIMCDRLKDNVGCSATCFIAFALSE